MSNIQKSIIDTTGCSVTDSQEIEEYMKTLFFGTALNELDNDTLIRGAVESWEDIQYWRTPEGVEHMAIMEKQDKEQLAN